MRYLRFNIILILVSLLFGCHTLQKLDNSDEYRNAPVHDKIITPPKGMKVVAIENHYPVPKADSSGVIGTSVLPPGSSLAK